MNTYYCIKFDSCGAIFRVCFLVFTPPARRAWRSYKFASLRLAQFLCFFRCYKLGYRSWVMPLCILLYEPTSPRLLNSISSKRCYQNTQFNMHTTTSKQRKGSACKDSYGKCFITTNFDKFHREGAINRGEILRASFFVFPSFSTVFPLKFLHIDQTHVLQQTEISQQSTLLK